MSIWHLVFPEDAHWAPKGYRYIHAPTASGLPRQTSQNPRELGWAEEKGGLSQLGIKDPRMQASFAIIPGGKADLSSSLAPATRARGLWRPSVLDVVHRPTPRSNPQSSSVRRLFLQLAAIPNPQRSATKQAPRRLTSVPPKLQLQIKGAEWT